MISKISLLIFAVASVTAVVCAKRIVREDLEMAATKGKRHISPDHLQHYSGSLQYHRPSVLFDGDHYGESDKGGYVVISHEKGKKKGHKTKGYGVKGKGSYGKPKGKGGSYGKPKGKGGSYSKGKGGGYGSKTKGGSYGNGKGGIPYYYSGGSYGSSNDGGGSSESNDKGSSSYGGPYGSVGPSYGSEYNSYGISQVGYSSYGSSNGGSSYENSGQGSHGGEGQSENDRKNENLSVDSVVEDSGNGGESSDEKQSEVSVDGGNESGSYAETSGKKRSTSPTEEALADSGDVGSSRRGRTIYNVAINTKKGNAFTENGNNTVRIDFKPAAGTGENAFSVSVHFLSSDKKKEAITLPQSARDGIDDVAKSQSLGEISLGGKRSVSTHSKKNGAKASDNEKEIIKVNTGSTPALTNGTKTGTSNSSSPRTRSNDNKLINGTTMLKSENRSNRTTSTTTEKSTTSRDREKNGTGCVSGCFSIPPVGLPSLSSESSGKTSSSQIVSSSVSPGNGGRNNKTSDNSDKGRVLNKEFTGSSVVVKGKTSVDNVTTELSSGQNNDGRKRSPASTGNNTHHAATTQRPMLLKSSQVDETSARVETATPLINRTRHVPRYPPALALTSPRFRPTSKPLMDHVGIDGNDENKTLLNPFHESSVPLGDQKELDQQISGNVAQKSVRYFPRYNPIGTAVRYLPRYNPISPPVATDSALIVGKEESPLIRITNLDDKGKRSTAGKEGIVPVSEPPIVVPYLPVDTYYTPLRRFTRRHKKHIAT